MSVPVPSDHEADVALTRTRYFRVRELACCPFCGGLYTRNDPPMHYGLVTVEGRITTDAYMGVGHRMCIELAHVEPTPTESL